MMSRRPARAFSAAPRSMPARANSGSASSRMRPRGSAMRRAWRRVGSPVVGLGLLHADPLGAPHVGAQRAQLLLEALVAAVEVVDAQHLGLALGDQAGQHQEAEARRSVAITVAPVSLRRPAHDRGAPLDDDVGAHALQLGHVHVAVLEDGLGQHRLPARARHQHHELRLHVGRETREGLGRDVDRLELALAAHADAVPLGGHLGAGGAQLGDDGVEVLGQAVAHQHVAAGDRRRDQQRPGLDAIGDDGVLDRVQLVDALDGDERRAGAVDRARPSC